MDHDLIESIEQATTIPLDALARLQLRADNFMHRAACGLLRRWDRSNAAVRESSLGQYIDEFRHCIGAVLSRDPPVFLVAIGGARPLWMVEALSKLLGDRPALFLLLIYWSIENPTTFEFLRRNAERLRARSPRHSFVFMCNTTEEQTLLEKAQFEAIFVNQNQIVSEKTFRPLPGAAIKFDAVYNAKLARFKRHHLAAAIDGVLYVSYRCPNDMSRSAGRAYLQRTLERSPHHRLANPIVNGLPAPLAPDEVNEAYSRTAVGLCLSPIEGAMRASMEYLLAGLPIVTTPSRGGRDVFLDAEYCLTAAADPRDIRDAVFALRARRIPHQIIRERTLARLEAARRQSRSVLNDVFARHGLELDSAAVWPPAASALTSRPPRSHIGDLLETPV
jgi:hypothetical protein